MFLWLPLFVLMSSSHSTGTADFWAYWGDGRAELSSYKLTIPRYGELRSGYLVMVFVTEDISRKTRIKIESENIPQSDRVPVLKLNRVLKFTTGIYDYSVMTSVFSSVEPELGRSPLQPMKISFSAQEWCGHVFQMLLPEKNHVNFTLHSYFEREGDQQQEIALPKNAVFEDNLPIWIRELRGEVLAPGKRQTVKILPSLWSLRARHVEAAFVDGWIEKQDGGAVEVLGKATPVWKWTWQVRGRTETWWVEKALPARIVRFASSDGTQGELLASIREPYWRLHDNDDITYRDTLKIPR